MLASRSAIWRTLGSIENAIDILFNHIAEKEYNLDVIALPFFYLMRHSVELGLKANLTYLVKYSRRQPASINLSPKSFSPLP
jgi:hypothetical protein